MSTLQHTWVGGAPSGVYKNHALSAELVKAAIAESKVMPFVSPISGYGRNKGENITFPRVSNLSEPTDAELTETIEIPEDALSLSTGSITVKELARAVTWTGKAEELSPISLPDTAKEVLQDQMSLYLDKLAMASGFKTAKICYIPTAAAAGTWDTDGTPSTAATANLSFYHVQRIRDYLYGTLHAKPWTDGNYIMLASVLACTGLRDDPKFDEWNKYTTPENLFKGEIGKIYGVRIVEVNNSNVLTGGVGTGSVLGEAVVFGVNAVKMAVAVPPHLRMKIPQDYGRDCGCSWYGILNFGPTWDTANAGEGNIIRVTSA
ncbi:MAG TPA: N4-gp56 family major capsid protein [Candidatus Wunengus sp. YC60]|uniref:N4-gp56 family major capsid protein n=1 Tax=Candidatus Wunengus sp. YC60 TaxID=3367697 RepID=UPI004027DB77